MKQSILGAALVVLTSLGSAEPAGAPSGPHDCERSNRAMLLSSKRQAEADFWLHVAQSLADPAGNAPFAIKNAYIEWSDAGALATSVFQAREKVCALFGHLDYNPRIVPTEFTSAITNPYFPQIPGRTLVHERQTAAGLERIETSVLHETKVVAGVTCRIVREHEQLDGVYVEDTYNWVAQHQSGAVWYFGELAMAYDDGTLDSLDGSWRFGKDGAEPGILMQGAPTTGDFYRQEFLLGCAEDVAQVLRVDASVQVPAGTFEHCLVIAEWDPLEPLEYLLKFFAPNVGMVLEVDSQTGERSELVEIHN